MWRCLSAAFLAIASIGSAAEPAPAPAGDKTARLDEWEGLKYGMFIHFNMNTFTGKEIDDGQSPSKTYAPTQLDVRQWIRVAREAGMKYAVLTAKHVSGHCLWDSADYDYDVATSGSTTDVVAEFMKACREEGIKPGIYYCVLDGHNEGVVKWKAAVSDAYFDLIRRQIVELHTRYPGIYEQWIDIPDKLSRDQRWDLYRTIKKLNPDCLILMNQAFSKGVNVPLTRWPTDLLNGEMTLPPEPRHDPHKSVDGKSYYLPMEVCNVIGSKKKWFWQPNDPPKPVQELYRLYRQTVDRGANLLLNVPPDRTGRIPAEYADALKELKQAIDDPSRLPP